MSSYRELYHYITDDFGYSYKNEVFSLFAKGKTEMKNNRYENAMMYFTKLENMKSEINIPSFVLFRLYSELEICNRELRNFELAYKYSSKRIALIAAFKM